MFDRRDNDGRGELLPGLRQKTRVSSLSSQFFDPGVNRRQQHARAELLRML